MTTQFFHLVLLLIIAGIISYAGNMFLPEPFKKIAQFVAVIISIFAVFGFIVYLLSGTIIL
jgi:hypothetical protein